MTKLKRGIIAGLLLAPLLWLGHASVLSSGRSSRLAQTLSAARSSPSSAPNSQARSVSAVNDARSTAASPAALLPSVPFSKPARTLSADGPEGSSLLPWENRAVCPAQANGQWSRYLQGFRAIPSQVVQLFVASSLDARLERDIVATLKGIPALVESRLGLHASEPVFYVHPSIEALRGRSCLADNGVAFYDGAIHLAGPKVDAETYKTVLHEYVHHVLFWNGIREPMWFQEGLAMHVAGERWANYDISLPGIPVEDMVDALPLDATPRYLERFYGQSYLMLGLVMQLCKGQSFCNERGLVAKLREGTAPAGLFEALIREAAPRASEPPLALWTMYFAGLQRSQ
jgi:hypothetical protein